MFNCLALPPPARKTPLALSLLLSVGLGLSLCACAPLMAPGNPKLLTAPAAWSAASGAGPGQAAVGVPAADAALWWQQFNDPELSHLMALAMQSNTSVQSAQAALAEARASRDVAAAALWPSLDVSASASRARSSGVTTRAYQYGLDAAWAPDLFGNQRNTLNASEANALALSATLADAKLAVAAELALDYITLRSTQERLAIAQENLASQQETLQITQWRQQAGLVTELDVEQARTAAAQTRAQVPLLQISLAQSRHALAVLTGQEPAALEAELSTVKRVPQGPSGFALELPAETLRQRADVRAAELQVAASLARVAQAEAARWPSFSLSGSIGLKSLSLGGDRSGVSSLLGSVTLPIFDAGALRAQVRVQEAALAQVDASYRATVLTALKDVEDALVALRGDRERLGDLAQAADAARQAATLARQRYGSGLIDFQTVLETQRTQLSTQDTLASAAALVSSDQVRLFQALGGGWQRDEDNENSKRSQP